MDLGLVRVRHDFLAFRQLGNRIVAGRAGQAIACSAEPCLKRPSDPGRRIEHLHPGGMLLFNIFVPDPNMALEQSDDLRHLMDVTDPETGLTRVLYQQSRYDFYNQIVSVRMLIEELDRDNVVSRSMYRDYQLRYCHRWEVHHMLQLCGFEIEALYGDFDLSDFDETSTEMIWVARKP